MECFVIEICGVFPVCEAIFAEQSERGSKMAEQDDGALSDGSDFDLGEDNLEEIEEIDQYDHEEDLWQHLLADDDNEEPDFQGFIGDFTSDPARFQDRVTAVYNRRPGVKVPLPENPTAADYFFLFWDPPMWQKLIVETNRYRAQQVATKGVAESAPTWRNVTEAEMKTFVGLCLMMGVIRLPNRRDYWRVTEKCWLAHTKFGQAMSRNRFDDLWRYLHAQDVTRPDGGDKLFKLRWFLNHLINKYRDVYTPGL